MDLALINAEQEKFTIKAEANAKVTIAQEQIRAAKESGAKDLAHVTQLAEEKIRAARKEAEDADKYVKVIQMQKAEVKEAAAKWK
jgi:hypothetical protein